MVIDSMFIYRFVDPDLRVEIFFKKGRRAENESVDFETRVIGTLVLKVEENFMQTLSAFLLLFWWQKIALKRPFDLHFHPSIIELN